MLVFELVRLCRTRRKASVVLLCACLGCGDGHRFLAAPEVADARSVLIASNEGSGFELELRSLEGTGPLLDTRLSTGSTLEVVLVYFRETLDDLDLASLPPFLEAHRARLSADETVGWQRLIQLPPALEAMIYPASEIDCDRLVASSEKIQLEPGPDIDTLVHLADGRLLVGGADAVSGDALLGFFSFDGRGTLESWVPRPELEGVRQLVFDGLSSVYGHDRGGWLFRADTDGQIVWMRPEPKVLQLRAGEDGTVIAFDKQPSTSAWQLVDSSTIPIALANIPGPVTDLAVVRADRIFVVTDVGEIYLFDGSTWTLDFSPGERPKPVAVFSDAALTMALAPGLAYVRRGDAIWEETENALASDVTEDRAGVALGGGVAALLGKTQAYVGVEGSWCLVFSTSYSHDGFDADLERRRVTITSGSGNGTWLLRFRY